MFSPYLNPSLPHPQFSPFSDYIHVPIPSVCAHAEPLHTSPPPRLPGPPDGHSTFLHQGPEVRVAQRGPSRVPAWPS